MKRKYQLSASNLRLCLGLFSRNGLVNQVGVAQFQWIYMLDAFYLYNTRSQLILATLKHPTNPDQVTYIRFRKKSRYRNIIEEWAKTCTPKPVISMPSSHVGRWERRIRYSLLGYVYGRDEAVEEYVKLLSGVTRRIHDGLRKRTSRPRLNSAPSRYDVLAFALDTMDGQHVRAITMPTSLLYVEEGTEETA
jgi:hypothetical protein